MPPWIEFVSIALSNALDDSSKRIFTYVAKAIGLFPKRGDVIEITYSYRTWIRRPDVSQDWAIDWLEAKSKWLVLSCSWTPVTDNGFVPLTKGTMTLVGYGRKTNGFIEVAWGPKQVGSRGLVLGSVASIVTGRPIRRLFDENGE